MPSWLDHKSYKALYNKFAEEVILTRLEGESSVDIVLYAADWLCKHAASYKTSILPEPLCSQPFVNFVRVWCYLPSLSSKEKREDLIIYAQQYNLTGFITPGKPGLVCVEGAEYSVNNYFSDIRTKSWSDLPPAHKKMSERYREKIEGKSFEECRAFSTMEEINFDLHGSRGNRNNLGMLEDWLAKHGLHYVFTKIFTDLQ